VFSPETEAPEGDSEAPDGDSNPLPAKSDPAEPSRVPAAEPPLPSGGQLPLVAVVPLEATLPLLAPADDTFVPLVDPDPLPISFAPLVGHVGQPHPVEANLLPLLQANAMPLLAPVPVPVPLAEPDPLPMLVPADDTVVPADDAVVPLVIPLAEPDSTLPLLVFGQAAAGRIHPKTDTPIAASENARPVNLTTHPLPPRRPLVRFRMRNPPRTNSTTDPAERQSAAQGRDGSIRSWLEVAHAVSQRELAPIVERGRLPVDDHSPRRIRSSR
jgi:hypothetical protein